MPRRMLFAASTGGHLAQLVRIAHRFDPTEDSVWVTFRTPQSESLLAGKNVVFVPYIAPRDVRNALRAFREIRLLLSRERFEGAVSTGAALAVAVLPAAKRASVPTTYVESVSRVKGPSLSGRILQFLHAASLFTQHDAWSDERWKKFPSVLSEFSTTATRAPVKSPRLFVTLGTIAKYRFDAVVDAVLATGLADSRTVWQLGSTDRDDLPGQVHKEMSASAFAQAVERADVVITHSGVGTILQLLESGVHPIVVPRSKAAGEHVDDHQFEIADLIRELGVGTVLRPTEMTAAAVIGASSLSTRPTEHGATA